MRGFSFVGAFVVGCAAGPRFPAQPAPFGAPAQLDGVVIHNAKDPLTELESYDAATLFHLAREARQSDRLELAQKLYERLLAFFPTSTQVDAARFNLGLVYEAQHHYDAAANAYQIIVKAPGPRADDDERTWLDAHYRLAVCQGQLGAWWEAVAIFDRILLQPSLLDYDRLEALVGRGIALRQAGSTAAAETALSQALRFFQDTSAARRFDDQGLAAEAAFHLGEIAAQNYEAVQLEFPVATLQQRLEEKCEYLLSAQHRFLRAIRFGDAHTVAAAGFRIGSLYERLYDTILALAPPPELDAEQAAIYQDEVKGRIAVLVKKAIMVYERTLVVGRTASTAEAWVARIEQALSRLRALYLDNQVSPPS